MSGCIKYPSNESMKVLSHFQHFLYLEIEQLSVTNISNQTLLSSVCTQTEKIIDKSAVSCQDDEDCQCQEHLMTIWKRGFHKDVWYI